MTRSKKILIAGVMAICMLLGSAFSYASYTSQLTATGSVSAYGVFDVYFATGKDAYYTTDSEAFYNQDEITVKFSSYADDSYHDAMALDIRVPADFTGSITFPVYVYNAGTIDAIVGASTSSSTSPFKLSFAQTVTVGYEDKAQIDVTLTKTGEIESGKTYNVTLELVFNQPEISQPDKLPGHNHES